MPRRKGELSNARIDRDWPHQVALLDDLCVMENYALICKFCEPLTIALSMQNGHRYVAGRKGRDLPAALFC